MKNNQGFSLSELLISVAIIGVLESVTSIESYICIASKRFYIGTKSGNLVQANHLSPSSSPTVSSPTTYTAQAIGTIDISL